MNDKVIICDLDGTLAKSKSVLGKDMADIIIRILEKNRFVVVSGGSYLQFQKQFLSQLILNNDSLKNLYLFPTNGSSCYVYNNGQFEQKYNEAMMVEQRKEIINSLEKAIVESGIDVSNPYGELIEDRGGQITFSGRGQEAPIEEKEKWDPNQLKRKTIVAILNKYIPQYEIRIGGATSIDITLKGINKAYSIGKIKEILNVNIENMVFLGDALYEGGNDYSVIETGVKCIKVSGPDETRSILQNYI